jgi:transposase
MRKTKNYTAEFKQQIVELRKSGRRIVDLVREYGVSKTSIMQWEKEYDNSGKFGIAPNMSESENELRTLCKENKHLRMENDILNRRSFFRSQSAFNAVSPRFETEYIGTFHIAVFVFVYRNCK